MHKSQICIVLHTVMTFIVRQDTYKKFCNLRDTYKKKKRKAQEKSGVSAATVEKAKQWKYMEMFNFINTCLDTRK